MLSFACFRSSLRPIRFGFHPGQVSAVGGLGVRLRQDKDRIVGTGRVAKGDLRLRQDKDRLVGTRRVAKGDLIQ